MNTKHETVDKIKKVILYRRYKIIVLSIFMFKKCGLDSISDYKKK